MTHDHVLLMLINITDLRRMKVALLKDIIREAMVASDAGNIALHMRILVESLKPIEAPVKECRLS